MDRALVSNIRIKRVMIVYENYNVIAFKSCIQIFTGGKISKKDKKCITLIGQLISECLVDFF